MSFDDFVIEKFLLGHWSLPRGNFDTVSDCKSFQGLLETFRTWTCAFAFVLGHRNTEISTTKTRHAFSQNDQNLKKVCFFVLPQKILIFSLFYDIEEHFLSFRVNSCVFLERVWCFVMSVMLFRRSNIATQTPQGLPKCLRTSYIKHTIILKKCIFKNSHPQNQDFAWYVNDIPL